jgi:hypothetical protein
MLRINPHQNAFWRDLNSLQIGAGSKRVVFDGLSPAQERLIAALYRGIADKQLPGLLADLGVKSDDGFPMVDSLRPLMLTNTAPLREPLSQDLVAAAFAEIIRASLSHSSDGEPVLLERKFRTVHVDDLGAAGLTIALGLASAGVGRLVSHDHSLVSQRDLGPNAYPSQLLGKSKTAALRAMLASSPNQLDVIDGAHLKTLDSIDLAVIIGQQAIQPNRYSQWLNRDVPHLALVFEVEFASLSPLVIPGLGPCLFCLEQARTAEDQSWPVVASQLITNGDRLDDVAGRLFCAGLAIKKILGHLDHVGGFSPTENELTGYRLDSTSGRILEWNWQPHSTCSCRLTSG